MRNMWCSVFGGCSIPEPLITNWNWRYCEMPHTLWRWGKLCSPCLLSILRAQQRPCTSICRPLSGSALQWNKMQFQGYIFFFVKQVTLLLTYLKRSLSQNENGKNRSFFYCTSQFQPSRIDIHGLCWAQRALWKRGDQRRYGDSICRYRVPLYYNIFKNL